MPFGSLNETGNMIIPPTISLLAAGMASGIILYISIRSRKNSKTNEPKREAADDGRCACCLAPFRIERGVRCSDCGARSCKKVCSRWDTSDNAWHCIFCHQRRFPQAWVKRNEKWFENFGRAADDEEELHSYFGTAKSRVYVEGYAAAVSDMEQIQEDREEKRMVHAIRNFVEKIVEGLVDNVDDTPIDQLYKDSVYDKFLEENQPPLIAALTRLVTCLEMSLTNKPSADPPAMAHAALREIVERAVENARKLPGLDASADSEHPREGRAIADHSYEDLLATAILNKVIERFQRERVDGNSNVLHDTDSSKAKYTTTEKEHGLEEDVANYATCRLECNGDRSPSIRQNDHSEPVSFMMEEQIEEVTTITSDDDELRDNDVLEYGCTRRVPFPEFGMDIVDPPRELSTPSPSSDSSDLNRNEYSAIRRRRHVTDHRMDLVSPIESWEDNWLFQKKRSSQSQPDAVAMLVPSSNAYYKALIGDRDAEDTSDLSECSSTRSDEEIEKELMEAINNVVPRTPKTSECDVGNNQEVSNFGIQLRKDEVDACQARTKIERDIAVCEHLDETDKKDEECKRLLKVSEAKITENEGDKSKGSESSSALITLCVAKREDKTKEKTKDTTECSERLNATAVESSVEKNVNMMSEKSSESCDRPENIADEDEEQRESEYTEHYDTAIQRHLDSLTKVEVCFGESETADETREIKDEQLEKSENNSTAEEKCERSEAKVQLSYATMKENHVSTMAQNDLLSSPPRPGTIAEREHKKWENAPPIENNPYSEESIRKRCLERQYSKNSDIPGTHYELTKLNEVNLDTLLIPNQSDIKRFGRDYYINQSKVSSGERQERARSAMSSMSSRPSSSLSQQSSCAGDEQREQQVSHRELEQFEGASLRGSLPRRCCRDPRASPHFAINPLQHLESARLSASDRSHDDDEEQAENLIGNARMTNNTIENATGDQKFRDSMESNIEAIFEKKEEMKSLEIDTDFRKLVSADWNQLWGNRNADRDGSADHEVEEPIIPRCKSREGLPGDQYDRDRDHDSGMCSIGSRDSDNSERNRWRQLYGVEDKDHHSSHEQISAIGGRKFLTTGGYKYHTFGGIRIRSRNAKDPDDLEDELTSPKDRFADHAPEFARLKFQTFGGIKRGKRIDGKRIPGYRRIRLRPILPEVAEQSRDQIKMDKSANFELYSNIDHTGSLDRLASVNYSASLEGLASFEHSTSSNYEESDWQDEEDDVRDDQIPAGYAQAGRINRNRIMNSTTSSKRRNLIHKRNVNSSSLWSLPNKDDEWQDEVDCASDEIIMNKFLKDVSRRRKACAFSDDDVATRRRGMKSRRYRKVLEEADSGKLEKSIVRNTERSSKNSRKSRQTQEQESNNKTCEKLYVRCLSDITIW